MTVQGVTRAEIAQAANGRQRIAGLIRRGWGTIPRHASIGPPGAAMP